MAVETLIADFARRGIRLIPEPPKLIVEPASRLTDSDRAAIREHKPILIRLLADSSAERVEIERVARLNRERREADWLAKRGYHFDPSAPSHSEYIPTRLHPAWSIIDACQRYGVALRIDPDGTLVVGRAGARAAEASQPWSELLMLIEANLEPVARLVEAGWHLRAEFPEKGAS